MSAFSIGFKVDVGSSEGESLQRQAKFQQHFAETGNSVELK